MCGTARYQALESMRDYLRLDVDRLATAGDDAAARHAARADELAAVEEELAAMAVHPDVVHGSA